MLCVRTRVFVSSCIAMCVQLGIAVILPAHPVGDDKVGGGGNEHDEPVFIMRVLCEYV